MNTTTRRPARTREGRALRVWETLNMSTVTESEIAAAFADLTFAHDGPVTEFVILMRVATLAAKGTHSPAALANAAHRALGAADGT